MTTTPDIAGLERFSHARERHLTKFFVGRKAELDFIQRAVDEVALRRREGHRKPAADGAVLITGVPGAGKTSLMDHLHDGWSNPKGAGPIGVAAGLADLTSQEALAQAVRRSVPASLRQRVARRLSSVSIGALGISGSVDLTPDDDLGYTERPIVLFIDEIQQVPTDNHAPAVLLLADLQKGDHGAPILPVLAGLAHSEQRLANVGLSRISGILPLGALSPDEAHHSAELFLDAFRVAGDRSGWPRRLARWSDGWPMHLHNALTALAAELAANGGNLDHIDRLAVKRQAARARLHYYGRRTREVLDEHPELLAAIMDGIGPRGMTKAESLRLIRQRAAGHEDLVPPAGAVFDAMLTKGLIQVGRREKYLCPIPSLRSWCAVRVGNDLHILAMEGDADDLRQQLADGDDPNARDARGRTPLHIAAEENWPDVAEALIAGGADPAAKDNAGRRPVGLARRGSQTWRLLAGPPVPVDADDWILGSDSPLEALCRLGGLSDDELLHADSDALVPRLAEEARAQAEREQAALQGNLEEVLRSILNRARDGGDDDGGSGCDEMPDSAPDRLGGWEPCPGGRA